MSKARKYDGKQRISVIINKLRDDLQAAGYAYGALFLAEIKTGDLGIFFPDGMPQPMRIEMLKDMDEAVRAARRLFTV